MKDACLSTTPTATAEEIRPDSRIPLGIRLLWIIPAVAVFCLVLFLSIGQTKLSQSALQFAVILVYSALIAPPAAFVCSWIGHRCYTKKLRYLIPLFTLALVAAATAGTLAGVLVLRWLGFFSRREYWNEFRDSWLFSIVITLVAGLSITVFETLRSQLQAATLEARTRQMEQERAYKLLAEAQLASLESRIHPHFLFNTLNSVASLIPTDPARAEQMVEKLASLLRFSLNAQPNGLVPLDQELKIVRDYLDIQSVRFGNRLRYRILVPEALNSVRVPPLSLQTLVENAVKHVASERAEDVAIELRGVADEAAVRLEVRDDGPGFSLAAVTPGHGLGNLIARLELLFGAAGRLDLKRENGETVVSISLPAGL
jgi:sensor histidine kinase YesM